MTIEQLLTDYWHILSAIVAFILGATWWVASTHLKVNWLADDVKGIKISIKDIEKSIEGISTNIRKNEVSASKSPSQLNETGIKISEGINGKEFVKKHLNAINYNNEMNEYQIQQACFDYTQSELIDKISIEERKALEMVAYNQGVSIQTVLTVLGFDLRNAKFKSLGIDIAGNGGSEN